MPRMCSVSNLHWATRNAQREEDLYSKPAEWSTCPLAVFPASYSRLPWPHVDALDGKITRTRSFECLAPRLHESLMFRGAHRASVLHHPSFPEERTRSQSAPLRQTKLRVQVTCSALTLTAHQILLCTLGIS